MKIHKPIVLVILDGLGHSEETRGNAISQADLPNIKKLNQYYPKVLLQASGIAVGIPWGEEGNSEVGHQSLGSGQVIYQYLPRITLAIENGNFFSNKILLNALNSVKKNNSTLHLLGLTSDGAVHSHINHLFALLNLAKQEKIKDVYIHVITDGRDTSPEEGVNFIKNLQEKINELGIGKIATISGRYYAMDRNKNYDRIEKAYSAMANGEGIKEKEPIEAIKRQYKKGVYDEYIKPVVITNDKGEPVGKLNDKDTVIFYNFRKDRARQMTRALSDENFNQFSKAVKKRPDINLVTMVEYEKNINAQVIFPEKKIETCLGEVLAKNAKKQLRIAETEKYAHVTYFFNGGKEKPFPGEDWELIPSKNTPSYADCPEMSAKEITKKLSEKINKDTYDFILVNYANPDMVGHTGDIQAAIKALETVDGCLGRLVKMVLRKGGCLLITADHGNVEEMINEKTGEPLTEHSKNPVPLWYVNPTNHFSDPLNVEENQIEGILADIAPTILDLMQIKKTSSMSGESLLPKLQNQNNSS